MVQAATTACKLEALLGITPPLCEVNRAALGATAGCVHQIVDFPLGSPRFVPHCETRTGDVRDFSDKQLDSIVSVGEAD